MLKMSIKALVQVMLFLTFVAGQPTLKIDIFLYLDRNVSFPKIFSVVLSYF